MFCPLCLLFISLITINSSSAYVNPQNPHQQAVQPRTAPDNRVVYGHHVVTTLPGKETLMLRQYYSNGANSTSYSYDRQNRALYPTYHPQAPYQAPSNYYSSINQRSIPASLPAPQPLQSRQTWPTQTGTTRSPYNPLTSTVPRGYPFNPLTQNAPRNLQYNPLSQSPPVNLMASSYEAGLLSPRVTSYEAPRNYSQSISSGRASVGNEISKPNVYTLGNNPSEYINMYEFMKYVKSSGFSKKVKSLGSPDDFRNLIITRENDEMDKKWLEKNIAETGLNFTHGDCKPVMTNVKLGLVDQPEVVFNPSSVLVPRCPQGCFSWQFDCIPKHKVNVTLYAAVYTIRGNKTIRKEDVFHIEKHTSCECSCQSIASCLGSTEFNGQRITPRTRN